MTGYEAATALLRGIHMAALLSLFGCLAFRRFVMLRDEVADLPAAAVARIGAISAWLALLSGAAWLAAVSGGMAGSYNVPAIYRATPVVAVHTHFGHLLCARLLLLAVLIPLVSRRHRLALDAALLGAGAALALQPLLGHIGALQDSVRAVLLPVEAAHLLAAGAWLGGLLPLLLCVVRARTGLAAILCERFTPVGLVAVGTIAVTALPQAGELIGGLPALFGTQYGHFALIKLGLFCGALGLACANRLVFTARVAAGTGRRGLIGSIAVETIVVACVVLAAAAMASSAPGAHTQPNWPFSWRLTAAAELEPEARGQLERLMIAAAAGLALVVISLLIRRFRIAALVLAAIVIAPFAPSLGVLFTKAYPTSYASSTTGFSVAAIVRGKTLFGQQCALCHDPLIGSDRNGDLTAAHIWGHLDGDLFWWITNGVTDPQGAGLMPAFGSMLSDDDRWALIDFIHARNIGRQAEMSGKWSPPVRAPSTPLACDGEKVDSLTALGTHDVMVVAEPGSPAVTRPETIPGVETIRMARDDKGAPGEGECITAAAAAWEAWRVLSGVAADEFAGYRAVLDGQGWLRAWLPPNANSDAVLAAVHDANAHPIAADAPPETVHHH